MTVIDDLLKYWPVVVVATSLVTTWAAWAAKKHFATHADLANARSAMGARLGETEDKIVVLEKDMAIVKQRLDSLPTKDDLHRIEVAVTGIAGDVKALGTAQSGVVRNLHLLMRAQLEDEG